MTTKKEWDDTIAASRLIRTRMLAKLRQSIVAKGDKAYVQPVHPDDGYAYWTCNCDGCEDLRQWAEFGEPLDELPLPYSDDEQGEGAP